MYYKHEAQASGSQRLYEEEASASISSATHSLALRAYIDRHRGDVIRNPTLNRFKIPPAMEEQHDNLGEDLAVEVDHRRLGENLVSNPGLGIRGDLEDIKVRLGVPEELNFDEALRDSPQLDQVGLERSPSNDASHAGQVKNRIGEMLDQPLAVFAVVEHRTSPECKGLHACPVRETGVVKVRGATRTLVTLTLFRKISCGRLATHFQQSCQNPIATCGLMVGEG